MQNLINKAEVLIEALPYMQKFYGQTFVVKYGGNAMVDEKLKASFAKDMILLKAIGLNPVIVHGGGPQIGKVLARMAIETSFVEGHRITDDETMSVVEMVLVGKVNKDIVGLINLNGGKAIGLSGKDGTLISAKKMMIEKHPIDGPSEIIDIGRVGRVTEINPRVIETIKGFIPVIAPVGVDKEGEALNINADLVAGALASALGAMKLILLTDTEGVKDTDGNLIKRLSIADSKKAVADGTVSGGMIPKLNCCIEALENGVIQSHIVDGRIPHAVLLEIFTDEGVGTLISPSGQPQAL